MWTPHTAVRTRSRGRDRGRQETPARDRARRFDRAGRAQVVLPAVRGGLPPGEGLSHARRRVPRGTRHPAGHHLGQESSEHRRPRPATQPFVPGVEGVDVDPDVRHGRVPARRAGSIPGPGHTKFVSHAAGEISRATGRVSHTGGQYRDTRNLCRTRRGRFRARRVADVSTLGCGMSHAKWGDVLSPQGRGTLAAMATPRYKLVDNATALGYHLVSSCVRRARLCGRGKRTGACGASSSSARPGPARPDRRGGSRRPGTEAPCRRPPSAR